MSLQQRSIPILHCRGLGITFTIAERPASVVVPQDFISILIVRGDAACVNEPLQQRVRAVRPSDFGERKHPELNLREGARVSKLEQPAQQLFVVRFGRNPPGHGRFWDCRIHHFRAGVGNDWRRFGFFPEPADEAEQVPPAELPAVIVTR